jgi:hypothetical protein
MKLELLSTLTVALVASSEAFAPAPSSSSSSTSRLQAEIGETGVAFENVAREWRCKVRFCSFLFVCLYECLLLIVCIIRSMLFVPRISKTHK